MSNVLSEKQLQLLAAVCEVMKADIDWSRVAKIADMTTAKYARDTWTVVRNKLMGVRKPAARKRGKEGKEGKGVTKKRKAAGDVADGGDDEEAPMAKKGGSRKKQDSPDAEEASAIKKEEEDAEDEFS
ncbi:hypothetical protein Tdes44962_MAKER06361 [Teratosphaeria destructans]|uniref:Uncharacterized protein n=1 Tax=Teratosphaeria destructans TaxID=418781 RepID=A0A9W7SHR6_9PEZI|nr:hypothetical protein Tdes44962_MAKER06361 [Teratosphaeria destructans]